VPANYHPAGMQRVGALWSSCKLIFYQGSSVEATGATLRYYNPTDNAVTINEIGVLLGQEGVMSNQITVNGSTPLTLGEHIEQSVPVTFDNVQIATSCEAGWNP
jgi:hypothetical protein